MPHESLKPLPEATIKKLFDELDTDSSGDITLAELELAGRNKKLGPLYSLDSCKSFLALADMDGSNTLDYDEFRAWVLDRERVLSQLFEQLDVDNKGCVSAAKFQHALVDMGCEMSVNQAEKIIHILDEDQNGTLEYEELLHAALIFPGESNEIIDRCFRRGNSFLMYEDDDVETETPSARILVAGTLSGSIARTMTAPQDRVAMNMRAGSALTAGHSSMFTVGRAIVRREGIRSLWVGNGVNCIKDGPRSGMCFLAYEKYKSLLVEDVKFPTLLEKFTCGGLAGFTSMTLTYPLFVAQARIAVAERSRYSGLVDCLSKTVRVEGIRGLLRGYDAAALSVAPERGISLMAYMTLRDNFVEEGQCPTLLQSLSFGAISSFVAQTVTAPMQTIMVRLMTQGESFGRPVVYHNALDCFRKTVRGAPRLNLPAEGYRALFRGLPAHLLKMIPGTAIQFAAFEYFSELAQPYTG